MTVILAIDCATGPCSVAVWKNGRVTACLENPKPSAQSAVLMPMVEDVLRQSGINYRDLSHVAATVGPGSFTGIRVGLAAARGIAFAATIKSLGFTTLETMAFAHKSPPPERGRIKEGVSRSAFDPHPTLPLAGGGRIFAMLNAGKGEYYYQSFGAQEDEPHLGTREQALAFAHGAIIAELPPSAAALAELAATRESSARPLRPFYIRPPDAKLPTKKP